MSARHLDNEELTAALEGAPSADTRAHLASCTQCSRTLDALQRAVLSAKAAPAADPQFLKRVLAATAQSDHRTTRLWVAMGGLSTALLLMFSVALLRDGASAPRGDGTRKERVQVTMRLVQPRAEEVKDGIIFSTQPVVLSVAVNALPGPAENLVVFLQDGGGRVTWLVPQWRPGTDPPACHALGLEPQQVAMTTELPALTVGEGNIQMARFNGPCSIGEMDAALEAGRDVAGAVMLVTFQVQ